MTEKKRGSGWSDTREDRRLIADALEANTRACNDYRAQQGSSGEPTAEVINEWFYGKGQWQPESPQAFA